MGNVLTPERFGVSWRRLGCGDGVTLARLLLKAYAEPQRVYHNLEHLADCLRQFDLLRADAARPDEVEVALWFHDAVYDPRAHDNEEDSAQWAHSALTEAGGPPDAALRVAELVRATQHTAAPPGRDAEVLVDVDLSILGRTDDEFDAYERKIRQEYAWVADADFRQARARILDAFLARPTIYHRPAFQQLYEQPARHNLQRSLAALRS